MFKVVCNNCLLCISPTYRGAERYVKQLVKRDKMFNKESNYEIIEDELEI